jgi:hypothetical protein
MAMADALLPAQFSGLEPFAQIWCLPTEHERYSTRLASTMAELQAFYDAFFPRAEEAIAYCDQFPLDDMPEEVQRLLQLIYSLIIVSMPVEAWRQPRVPDSGAAEVVRLVEPIP